jgi:Uma2 family endonuclease
MPMSVTFAGESYRPITVPTRATASLNAFRKWAGDPSLPEKTKVSYFRGEVWVEMGKEQIFSHVRVKTEFTRVLANIAKELKLGMYLTDGLLLTHVKAELSGNPDGVYVSNDAFTSKRVKLIEGKEGGFVELLGTPDMVLEVVSDSSERKDNQTLFEAYYDAGIPEYWLVDARGDAIEFHIYKRGAKRYSVTKTQPGGWAKSAAFGKSFRLVRGTDATGNPEFTLEVK